MVIECYAFRNKNKELEAPFLEYLEKYSIKTRDSKKRVDQKTKQLMNIKAHLQYLSDNKGKYNLPPIIQKYKDRSIGIIKIREGEKLVRIAFFTKRGNAIILLGAMDKPRLYGKGMKHKVDKMIEKYLDRMEEYRLDYITKELTLPLIQ